MNGFPIVLYSFYLISIVSILAALVFLLMSVRKYRGVIGSALTYLSAGVIMSALISVVDLLSTAGSLNTMLSAGDVNYQDVLRSLMITLSFLMISAGFFKLSRIYKRI